MERNLYSVDELEIGKLYCRGNMVVVLRERTGEKERLDKLHLDSKKADVYIFDELRDFYIQDWIQFRAPLGVRKNVKVLLNPEYKCFHDFDLEQFKKEKIQPLQNQIDNTLTFINEQA